MSATKPEIDWNDDEAVVRAAFSEVYSMGSVHHFPDWKEARKYPIVFEFEEKHKFPVVEVTRELYLALVYVLRASCLNTSSSAHLQGMKAIKLYEEKVKP